jgi:hypothetical protein
LRNTQEKFFLFMLKKCALRVIALYDFQLELGKKGESTSLWLLSLFPLTYEVTTLSEMMFDKMCVSLVPGDDERRQKRQKRQNGVKRQ